MSTTTGGSHAGAGRKKKQIIEQYNKEAVKKGPKRIPLDILYLGLCEQYGRSREQLMNTPQYIIDVALDKNQVDYKINKLK